MVIERQQDDGMSKPGYTARWFVRIPMRDGVELSAILVLPKAQGPFPTIFRLTPYISDTFLLDGAVFADRGYAYLCADTRGRGESGGGPYRQALYDQEDGTDAIYWIARQDWSDERVVLYGSSYSGSNQWAIAAAAPEPLRAIAPTGVSLLGFDFPRPGGILPASIFQVMTLTEGRALHSNAHADTATWTDMLDQIWTNNLRLTTLTEMCGSPAPMFHQIAASASGTEPFEGCILDSADYANIKVPVFSSTGLADLTCPGTLEAHKRFLALAHTDLAEKSCLIIGPWEHLGLETGSDQVGELKFGPAAKLDMRELKLDWFDWILGRASRPQQTKSPVFIYRAGEEVWIEADGLDKCSDGTLNLILTADGNLIAPSDSNRIVRLDLASGSRTFVCDPDDERVINAERRLRSAESGKKENAPTIRIGRSYNDLMTCAIGADPKNEFFSTELGNAGVEYSSAVIDKPLTLSGHPIARLWLSLSTPDADLAILVSALLPTGENIHLSGDVFRIRDRNEIGREEIATPGIPIFVERSLRFISRTLPAGSRIRLVVRNGTSIRLEKNLHTATPVRQQKPDEAVVATVTILSDQGRQSAVAFPVCSPLVQG